MKSLLLLPVSILSVLGWTASAQESMPVLDHPPEVHKWAIPSINHKYFGYWVGGGALSRKRGDMPAVDEGTWGWDFKGGLIRRRVDLLWWHGRRYQGGTGAYKTDGPRLPHLPHEGGHESHNGHSEHK